MKIFLKVLNYFFTTLGVIFFIILMFVVYLFVADPFNLKPLFSSFNPSAIVDGAGDFNVNTGAVDKNPMLNADQEKILESIGVDVDKVPTEMTPELEKCLIEKVGAQRADEIAKGAEPTAIDILKASSCLK